MVCAQVGLTLSVTKRVCHVTRTTMWVKATLGFWMDNKMIRFPPTLHACTIHSLQRLCQSEVLSGSASVFGTIQATQQVASSKQTVMQALSSQYKSQKFDANTNHGMLVGAHHQYCYPL